MHVLATLAAHRATDPGAPPLQIGHHEGPDVLVAPLTFSLPMKPPRSRNVLSWLSAEPAFARLGEQATRLAALEADVRRALPGLSLTVVAFEHKQLVVGASHASMAAKVRQVEPTLIAALGRQGWAVEKVRFKPLFRAPAAPIARRDKTAPGADAVAHITDLSQSIEHPGLKDALARLAARHSG
jgi:hypothetical protein